MDLYVRILLAVDAYIFYSMFITSYFIHKHRESFVTRIVQMTVEYNEQLKEQLDQNKISPMLYKNNIRDIAKEIRSAKRVNLILSPFIAPKVTLAMLLNYMMKPN